MIVIHICWVMNLTAGLLTSFSYSVQSKEQFMQFSKEPIMTNFGDLPFGTIPESLRHVRPFRKFFRFKLIYLL